MKQHITPESLSEYVDKALNEQESLRVEQHLLECASCRRQAEELAQVTRILGDRPTMRVPPFFAARLSARLADARRRGDLFADFVWIAKRLAPGLAMLLLVVFAWSVSKQSGVETDTGIVSVADSSSVMTLLVQNDSELTLDEVLQLAISEQAQ